MSAIQDKHAQLLLGGILNLGAETSAETAFPDGGAKQHFEHGVIYFHPRVGVAFEVHGLLLTRYIELGENQSGLGYPTSDETDEPAVPGGRVNRFEGGSLTYSPQSGVGASYHALEPISQVVVKVVDALPLGIDRGTVLGLDQLAALVGLFAGHPMVEAVRLLLPDLTATRLFEDLSFAEIAEMVQAATEREPGYSPPLFNNYLVIACPPWVDADLLASALNGWAGIVEFAYRQALAHDPVVGTGNPRFVEQGYLRGFNIGISVQAAWAKGADGSGMRFVDLQQGWLLTHEDLPKPIPLLAGINRQASFAHGAAVLGIMVAKDDNRGIAGIAPNATAHVISYHDPANLDAPPAIRALVASRILVAARSLRYGDVLQLEVQLEGLLNGATALLPAETDPAVFRAIELVTMLGILVVECAGNFNSNLDGYTNAGGKHVLDVNHPDFKESGAIMVGSCTSPNPHGKSTHSNFGSRIDCWAWGENIVTAGDPANPNLTSGYTTAFGNTSGAAPIISGICMLVQNLQVLLQPRPGRPGGKLARSMRDLLRDPANGNPVSGSNRAAPDMEKIIANHYLP